MGIFKKEPTKDDLQGLICNQVLENKELEYKGYTFVDGKFSDKQKDKLLKEIVAFANTNGGTIILGIGEDENHFPTVLNGTRMSMNDFDEWLSSLRQMILSRIRPHLHGVEIIPVEIEKNNIAVAVFVPKSYSRPHSFWDGNKDEFFMRYSNGMMYMDIDDLRKEFLYSSQVQDKIRQFRQDRISMILANECVGDLGSDAKIVFHLIPEWSFELGNAIDINWFYENPSVRPLTGDSWKYRYNADGYCVYKSDSETGAIHTYTQFFHNGIVEATEIRLVSGYKPKCLSDLSVIQGIVIKSFTEYGDFLRKLGVPRPWHILGTMLNAKGYIAARLGWPPSKPIERNIINLLDGICTDEVTLEDALKPIFTSLSNAFGWPY